MLLLRVQDEERLFQHRTFSLLLQAGDAFRSSAVTRTLQRPQIDSVTS